MNLLDLVARILAAVLATVRFLQQPTRRRAGLALATAGSLLSY